ncbi:HWE histidine kinase domain-containing protein [Aurantimonas sp. VKM B-3413]|uniref:HWE histidine kinase domain-containing protein n=1 Tax=Aurantimonas sp. VKM B-3413 TaxID=2779401 RepID=UPI001E4CE345|nr:HWE histidine kinase domain-containing protein [Aurantimonas sp. VKM B-3413]MCB8837610.1 GAF domain-containing protein [Aurantimonas sp. VKM B-3413]
MSDQTQTFDVDLSNCDREPIHLLGQIQGFGFLVAVSMDWMIQHVSANIGAFCGREADEILGGPVADILPPSSLHAIRGRLQLLAPNEGSERIFGVDLFQTGRAFDVAIHISDESIVIEAEPSSQTEAVNPGALVKSMIARIQRCESLPQLYNECVRQLRAITGFDRVMLYRFSENGAGSVIAEALGRSIEPFLGLNYPAADIPKQARALYIRNQIRIIADVDATPVPVVPPINPHGQALDLSLSLLRSVSPIHIEYLQNMGVSASFSISIVIDGKLWGLFALHHYSARHLPMELRSTAELFGQMVSLVIEGRLAKEMRLVEETARDLHDKVVGRLISTTPSIDELIDFASDFRELIAADGFALWAHGVARTVGTCPFPDDLPALSRFLNRAAASRVYATDNLGAVYPKATDFADRAAGLLAIPISRTPRDYLLFFRREIVQNVTWAGNPQAKEAVYGPNGSRLTPRKSFEAWQETVRGKSTAWTLSEMKAAEALRVSILEVLLRFNEENERQRAQATQRQELLIAELNHRVRNILALMRALVVQSRAGARTVEEFSNIIGGRIQALARAHDQITEDSYAAQSLRDIIQTEIEAYIGSKAGRVSLTGPEILVDAKAFSTLALVFHEMVTNSAKYGALSDSRGAVEVEWMVDENDCCTLRWRELDGPPVAPPVRRGFGSTIIERSIPHDLGGTAEVDYRLAGLQARFVLPPNVFGVSEPGQELGRHEAVEAQTGKGNSVSDLKTSLQGLRGLVVEDNMIISLDAEQLLLDQGMAEVFTAMSVADAKRIIEKEAVDVAILDVNLGSETSFPLITPLNQKGVPYVFVTGYGEKIDLPEDAADGVEAIKKPFAAEQVVAAVSRAASRRR